MTEGRRKREKRRETKDRFPVLLAFSSPRSSLLRFPFPPAPPLCDSPLLRFLPHFVLSPPSIHPPRLPLPLALSLILPRPSFVPLFSFAVLAPSLPCFLAPPCPLLLRPPPHPTPCLHILGSCSFPAAVSHPPSITRLPRRRASPSALPSSNLGSKPWSCLRHALSAMDQAIPRVPRCLFAGCAPSVVAGPSATLRRKRSFVDARVRLSFAVAPILLVPAPDCVAFRSAALFCVRARLAVAVPLRRGLGVCALPALLRARPKVLGGIS